MGEGIECARSDCFCSPAKSVWLSLRSAGAPRFIREAPLGISLCVEHAKEATVDDFLDGSTWKEVCLKFRKEGLPAPTPRLTKLDLRDIEEDA